MHYLEVDGVFLNLILKCIAILNTYQLEFHQTD